MSGLRGHCLLCPPDRDGRGEQGSANCQVLCTHRAPRARWLSGGQGGAPGGGGVGQRLPGGLLTVRCLVANTHGEGGGLGPWSLSKAVAPSCVQATLGRRHGFPGAGCRPPWAGGMGSLGLGGNRNPDLSLLPGESHVWWVRDPFSSMRVSGRAPSSDAPGEAGLWTLGMRERPGATGWLEAKPPSL